MESLVSTNWLHEHLHDTDLVILDCTNFSRFDKPANRYRTVSGHPQWEKEHIPGAGYADFSMEMSGDNSRYRNTLPNPEQLAIAIGALGISNNNRVVLYDSLQSMWATRLWWMLRWIGFDNVAVLDGGLPKWQAEGGCTVSSVIKRQPAKLIPHVRSGLFVSKEVVLEGLGDASILIVDALSKEQFNGQISDLGLSGHIPGAVNVPAEGLVDPGTGLFLPIDKLSSRFQDDKSRRTLIYCGSGIAAASVAFTMTRLGFGDISIYMPGLQEWVHEKYPMANSQIEIYR